MKREIKFRAWDETCQPFRMIEWKELSEFPANTIFNVPTHEVEVMQYTGLSDSSSVEIYEGDVLDFEIKGLGKGKAKCYYAYGCFFLKVEGQKDPFPLYEYELRSDIILKVIGNIHKNPELINS